MSFPVAIALGSNLGDSRAVLAEALVRISVFVDRLEASSFYETPPMYLEDQPSFLNAVAVGDTELGPWPLLQRLKALEAEMGRVPTERNGPRLLDLDLITYGGLSYIFRIGGEARLEIPHPRAFERGFVILPLAEICPDWEIPGFGRAGELAQSLAPPGAG